MVIDLESGTDVAIHALYDPEAVPDSVQSLTEDWPTVSEQLTAEGRMLFWETHSDGGMNYRIFVDESLPPPLQRRAVVVGRDLLLRVPGGTLVACGGEYINDQEQLRKARQRPNGIGGLLSVATVPPGNYLIDGYVLDWSWNEEIEPELQKELGRKYAVENHVTRLGCLLMAGGLIGGAFFLIADGWRSVPGWCSIALFLVGIIAQYALEFYLGADYATRYKEVERRFPYTLLAMKRLDANADISSFKGGAFDPTTQSLQASIVSRSPAKPTRPANEWLLEVAIIPLSAPVFEYATFHILQATHKDVLEIACLIILPATYVVLGLFRISLRRGKIAGEVPDAVRTHLESYAALATMALVFLAAFQVCSTALVAMLSQGSFDGAVMLTAGLLYLAFAGLDLASRRYMRAAYDTAGIE
jgi:hypothetical protein